MDKPRVILDSEQLNLTIKRLCHQLVENHNDFKDTVIIGLQPRGVYLANRIVKMLEAMEQESPLISGKMDITFYRDDFRRRKDPLIPSVTDIDFSIEDKKVVLVDDVLYTGRTIRAGLDAMLAFGRPKLVELLVLIDRRFSRHLPIEPNYVGKTIDAIDQERVDVQWKETDGKDQVLLYRKAQ